MGFSNKFIDKPLKNIAIKSHYTSQTRKNITKVTSFRNLCHHTLNRYVIFYQYFSTIKPTLQEINESNVLTDKDNDSNDLHTDSSIISKDATNSLTYSLIEDAFDAVADEYNKKVSNSSLKDESQQFDFNLGQVNQFEGMTPAQKFYSENKDKLLKNAKKIFLENSGQIDSIYNIDEPVIRPPKNHVWEYGSITTSDYKERIILQKGQMPTINNIIKILEQEHFVDCTVINLDECNRRDIGLYAIIATGKTFSHCRRVGRLLYRIFVELEIPFVSQVSYAWSRRTDQWIIAHLGPLHVHLMTQDLRDFYNLEKLWSNSDDINMDSIESNSQSLDSTKNKLLDSIESIDNINTYQIATENDVIYEKFKKDDDYS